MRLPRHLKGSLTCRKSATWDRRLYFPSEGRRAYNFFASKNPTASAGFEPANLGTRSQHANHKTTEAANQWMLHREIITICSQIHTIRMNTLCGLNVELLEPLAKSRKAIISFVMSVRPSARPHGTRLRLNWCSRNFMTGYLAKICHEQSSFIRIWQE
jgi:hypothetical protein